MKLRSSWSYVVMILIVCGGFACNVHAQSTSGILVDVVPANPAPYQDVKITLKSYENNLDTVLISWSVDGKTIASGIGKKAFSTTASAAGVNMSIIATISLPDGPIQTKIALKPSVMVLLWQADDAYVPPFYRGKALPSPQSEVKVVAIPEVKSGSGIVAPQNMTYAWQEDYTNNVDGSGYGKDFFMYTNDYLDDTNTISVTASTTDQSTFSDASVDIGTTPPKILLYKNDDTLGTLWQNTITDGYVIQGPQILQAVPYFISPAQLLHPALVWNWSINNNPITLTSLRKDILPLQIEKGAHGTSKIDLEIENKDKVFQTTNKEINVQF